MLSNYNREFQLILIIFAKMKLSKHKTYDREIKTLL